ncbi:MAG: hypothetical protein K2Y21_02830 [Phycisphaerales bacterium]|nr:hypothetical protein [Phycisphaerales bacterium]
MVKHSHLAALSLSLLAGTALAQPDADKGPILTIYSSLNPGEGVPRDALAQARYNAGYGSMRDAVRGFAFVRQNFKLDLNPGRNSVRVSDVAALIEPTTVTFESLTAPTTTRVLEQNFQFDLVGRERLLERYLDKNITLSVKNGEASMLVTGKLLSTSGGIILRSDNGTVGVFNNVESLQLPSLPDGLLTKPTLLWEVDTQQPGSHNARIAYETGGMTWWADYNALFSPGKDNNSGTLDLAAWVSIVNQSGASYADSKLRLVAGNVNRVTPQNQYGYAKARRAVSELAMADRDEGFQQKAFFEYHLYTLGRTTTLPDNSTKQLELFPVVRKVPCEKVLVYDALAGDFGDFGGPMLDQNFGQQGRTSVDVYLKFKNDQKSGLGIPLPAGRVRVSQADTTGKGDAADGLAEFVGEDVIKHTPKDENVLLKIGSAFDVVGERTQVDFKVDSARRTMEETIEIKVKNRKDVATNLIVRERLYRWTNWELVGASKYDKVNASTIHFPVTLEAGKEATIRYTVKYSW